MSYLNINCSDMGFSDLCKDCKSCYGITNLKNIYNFDISLLLNIMRNKNILFNDCFTLLNELYNNCDTIYINNIDLLDNFVTSLSKNNIGELNEYYLQYINLVENINELPKNNNINTNSLKYQLYPIVVSYIISYKEGIDILSNNYNISHDYFPNNIKNDCMKKSARN